jgi:hypothetical protein
MTELEEKTIICQKKSKNIIFYKPGLLLAPAATID